eukprot:gnl/MRDRNA2_/MRDRNA2_107904_c0_seq1.p1 gnl/MRDRNA2_/MRDRNA2_107904_c0~~gnl/MRDRNA2_/MRDRNA2_107904_c0_seq1.p1  ORF type:complete len:143 (+),score=21.50 gnl/MRDRNA2_/MRDRNA2_107904_c0_seq1:109-537(+)
MWIHRQLWSELHATHVALWILCSIFCATGEGDDHAEGEAGEAEKEEGGSTMNFVFGIIFTFLIAFSYWWRMRRRRLQFQTQRQSSRSRLGAQLELEPQEPADNSVFLEVQVPEDLEPGAEFCLPYNGVTVQVKVPEGCSDCS